VSGAGGVPPGVPARQSGISRLSFGASAVAGPRRPGSKPGAPRRNRDAIVAAALEALTESPDASLNAIAKRAGVANATLYRHFPTREALVLAAYQHEVRKLVDAADLLLDQQPPIDALHSWVERLARCAVTAGQREDPADRRVGFG
jgi:AcrR family transcriptional regulator